jgi:hypothetical protein
MKTLLLFPLLALIIASCSNNSPNFSLFDGKWITEDETTTEQWQKENDTLYIGKSFMVKGNDTILLENITIHKISDSFFYVPQVLNQNEGKKIPFKLVEYNRKHFVFENPSHDFPQRITYFFRGRNKLLVRIEKINQADGENVEFRFEREEQ